MLEQVVDAVGRRAQGRPASPSGSPVAGDLRPRRPGRSPRRRAHLRARARRVLAALCVAVAAWLIVSALRPPVSDPGVPVLVTSDDAAVGARLGPADVTVRPQPADTVPAGAITDAADLPPRPLAAPVRAGEVLTDARFLGPGALEATDGGLVLAHVAVADPAVLTAVRPGQRVDVVSTLDGAVVATDAAVSSTGEAGAFLLVEREDAGALAVAASGGVPGVGVTLVLLPTEP